VTSAVVLASNPLRREGEVSDKNRRLEAGLRLRVALNSSPGNAADSQPGNRPYFIASKCPTCEAALVLVDRDQPASEVWHDEWECPRCDEGVYLDWPESAIEALKAAGREGPCIPIDRLYDKLQCSDDLRAD